MSLKERLLTLVDALQRVGLCERFLGKYIDAEALRDAIKSLWEEDVFPGVAKVLVGEDFELLVPADRKVVWQSRLYVSPYVALANWQTEDDIDWSRAIYVPVYYLKLLRTISKFINGKNPLGFVSLMPRPNDHIRRVPCVLGKDYLPRVNVWEDVTDVNPLEKQSALEKILVPYLFEIDIPEKRIIRAVHDSQKGIICPVHTPESKRIGLVLFKAKGARLSSDFRIIPANASEDKFSTAALHVPYINFSDSPRVMMGAKNYRQAVEVEGHEEPIIKTGHEVFAPGVNALVVYGLFEGFTIEDGIVVSKSFAEKMRVRERVKVKVSGGGGLTFGAIKVKEGQKIKPWQVLAEWEERLESRESVIKERFQNEVRFPYFVEGIVRSIKFIPDESYRDTVWRNPESIGTTKDFPKEVVIEIEINRPLMVGDKLTGRHGNKGVVSKIVDDVEMPEVFIDGKWMKADVIMTPLGVISRKNIGALIETSFALAKKLGKPDVPEGAFIEDLERFHQKAEEIRSFLRRHGADNWGRFKVLHKIKGEERQYWALAGYQYILRLHHHAETKLTLRGKKGGLNAFGQPTGGRKNRGGQRIGEMELWTLMAHGKKDVAKRVYDLVGDEDVTLDAFLGLLRFRVHDRESFETVYRFKLSSDKTVVDEESADEAVAEIQDFRRMDDCLKLYALDKKGYYLARPYWVYLYDPPRVGYKHTRPKPVISVKEGVFSWKKDFRSKLLNKLFKLSLKDINKEQDRRRKKKRNSRSMLEPEKSSKYGFFRRLILGARVNFSGRAVIVPDPSLPVDTVRIPRLFFEEIGLKDPEGDMWILLGRQPSLHRHNIQAFKAEPWDELSIAVNPMICSGFGADFDGDTMWFVWLGAVGDELRESLEDMTLLSNFWLIRSGAPSPAILYQHDYAWGYFLRFNPDVRRFVEDFVVHGMAAGKLDRNMEDLDNIDKWVRLQRNPEDVLKLLMGSGLLEIASSLPPSFSYFMLKATEGSDAYVFMDLLVNSGAKGSSEALSELRKEIKENIKGSPLKSFSEGLTFEEYYKLATRGRDSMMHKKLTVASSGRTTRDMVYKLDNLVWADVKNFLKKFLPEEELVDPARGKPFDDDYPIGVATGHVLGERATQQTMKAFHTGGGAISGNRFKKFLEWCGKTKLIKEEGNNNLFGRDVITQKFKQWVEEWPELQNDEERKFLRKLVDSFHPMWLLIGARYMVKSRGKRGLFSAMCYSPNRVLKNGIKVKEYAETSQIWKWLMEVRFGERDK